jgi:hypothetical protein
MPDPLDRLVEDGAQLMDSVLADRLGLGRGDPQVASELAGEPLEVAGGAGLGGRACAS